MNVSVGLRSFCMSLKLLGASWIPGSFLAVQNSLVHQKRGTGARRLEQPTELDSLTKQPTELIPSAVVRVVWREGQAEE